MINDLPPLIIYNNDKKLYYECLEKFDREETVASMNEFIKYEIEKTWEETLKKQELKTEKNRFVDF